MSFDAYTLDKNVPIPLYYQLRQIILDELNKGNLNSGDTIPTEDELCQRFGISRTTVRQAISMLVNDGFLYRVKSKGTFVSAPKIKTDLVNTYGGYNAEVQKLNMVPSMVVCGMEVVPASNKVARRLQIREGDKVVLLSRKRCADETVMGFIESYLKYPLCEFVMDAERLEKTSLYEILKDKDETRLHRMKKTIEACTATDAEAKILKIKPGSAISLWENIGYPRESAAPIIYETIKYRGDKNVLSIELTLE